MNNFDYDLDDGKNAERFLGPLVEKRNNASGLAYPPPGKHSAYDFNSIKNDRVIKHECKKDNAAAIYGNVAIETGNIYGQKTGLSITEADYWLHFLPHLNIVVSYPTEVLKAKIAANNYPSKRMGDGKRAMGVVISLQDFTGSLHPSRIMDTPPYER